jgi:hypothetical protein
MERALYNNVLAGMALDGKTFFYVNPLEVRPHEAKRRYDMHYVKTQRVPWFGCACCPPNIARTLASLGYYSHSVLPDGLAVHLYADCRLDATLAGQKTTVALHTDYPWDGAVRIEISPAQPATFTLRLRLPGWCTAPGARLNDQKVDIAALTRDGYLHLAREWRAGDVVTLDFPMPIVRVRAHPAVHHDAGCVALQRGPMVFCVEQADNGPLLSQLRLPKAAPLTARFVPELLGGAVVIEGPAERVRASSDELYSTAEPTVASATFTAVPYCLWNNRGEGEMRVWIRES